MLQLVALQLLLLGQQLQVGISLQSYHCALGAKDLRFCILQVIQMYVCPLLVELQ